MLELMFVTHVGPSQEGIEPIILSVTYRKWGRAHWVLIESESQMKLWIKGKGKDIDALNCLGTTLKVALNFS